MKQQTKERRWNASIATVFIEGDGRMLATVFSHLRNRGIEYFDLVIALHIEEVLAGEPLAPYQPAGLPAWLRFQATLSAVEHGSAIGIVVVRQFAGATQSAIDELRGRIARAAEAVRSWELFDEVTTLIFHAEAGRVWLESGGEAQGESSDVPPKRGGQGYPFLKE